MLAARSSARMQDMQGERLQEPPAGLHSPNADFGRSSAAHAHRTSHNDAARPAADFEPWDPKGNPLRELSYQGGPSSYASKFREEFQPLQANLRPSEWQRDAGMAPNAFSVDCVRQGRDPFQHMLPPPLQRRGYEEARDLRFPGTSYPDVTQERRRPLQHAPQVVWEGRPVGDAAVEPPCQPSIYDDGITRSARAAGRQLVGGRAVERVTSHWDGKAGHKRTRSAWDGDFDGGVPCVRARPVWQEERGDPNGPPFRRIAPEGHGPPLVEDCPEEALGGTACGLRGARTVPIDGIPRAAMPRGSLASYAREGDGVPVDDEGARGVRGGRRGAMEDRRPFLDQGTSSVYGSDLCPDYASEGHLNHVSDRSRSLNPESRTHLPAGVDRKEGYHSRHGCPTRVVCQSPDPEEGPMWQSKVAMPSHGPKHALHQEFDERGARKSCHVWEEGFTAGKPQANREISLSRQRPQCLDVQDVYATREGYSMDRVWLQRESGRGPEVRESHNNNVSAKAELKRRRRALLAAVQEQLEEVLESD